MLIASAAVAPAPAQWTQWGGPQRDFSCDATGLTDKWPEGGPATIWSREIGPGHSSILVEGDTLYTMCRRGDKDAVLALSTATGKTIWETRYDAPTKPDMQLDFGAGPHSTPRHPATTVAQVVPTKDSRRRMSEARRAFRIPKPLPGKSSPARIAAVTDRL